MAVPRAARRLLSGIGPRLLLFNLLLVFLPVAGLLYLGAYERQLLRAQERSMAEQGRILAAALGESGELVEEETRLVLGQLRQQQTARLRIVDRRGRLLADTSLLGPRREPPEGESAGPDPRSSWLYRAGAVLFALARPVLGPPPASPPSEVFYPAGGPLLGPEVAAALAGRYGAATRVSADERSVTLYSALPVRSGGEVVGAVVVSQSTYRLLRDLYEVRKEVFAVFLASVGAAIVLTLFLTAAIAQPLRRLATEAAQLLDRRGRVRTAFSAAERQDEIGELARSLAGLAERLRQHLRASETLAADLSHELKNPLAAIRGASEMLAEVEDPAERRRFARIVEAESARMDALLAAAREVAVLEAQLEAEDRRPVALREVVQSVVEARRLSGAPIELLISPGAERAAVLAAPERLTQVLDNLLDNALGFSAPGESVTVSLGLDGAEALLEVRDRGPGVPAPDRERIFERFFSHRPGGRAGAHLGLGLAIVRAIVTAHGGTVAATDAPGGGAIFEVRLPLARVADLDLR